NGPLPWWRSPTPTIPASSSPALTAAAPTWSSEGGCAASTSPAGPAWSSSVPTARAMRPPSSTSTPTPPGERSRWQQADVWRQATSGAGRTGSAWASTAGDATACDDLAGVAAALGALDRARNEPALRHFAVLLTRAEELGFVGAIGAARDGTLPAGARILSIECSRSFADSPLGAGPIVRV